MSRRPTLHRHHKLHPSLLPHRMYAIGADAAFLKFGFSRKPKVRLAELQVGSPFTLRLIADIEVPNLAAAVDFEKLIHTAAVRFRVRGEWFHSNPKTLQIAEAMKLELPAFEKLIRHWANIEWYQARKDQYSNIRSNLDFS